MVVLTADSQPLFKSPHSNTRQLVHIMRQGYTLFVAGNSTLWRRDRDLRRFLESDQLKLVNVKTPPTSGETLDDLCGWRREIPQEEVLYAHLDLLGSFEGAARCIGPPEAWSPQYLSMQLGLGDPEFIANLLEWLSGMQYRKFKLSRHSSESVGGLFGDLAEDDVK